ARFARSWEEHALIAARVPRGARGLPPSSGLTPASSRENSATHAIRGRACEQLRRSAGSLAPDLFVERVRLDPARATQAATRRQRSASRSRKERRRTAR